LTGKTLWKHTYACKLDPNSYEGGPSSTPSVDGDRVYTVSKEGHVFCLKTTDGAVVWSKNLIKDFGAEVPQWGFAASALILGDMAVIDAGGTGASTVALNKKDGSLIWKNGDEKGGYATPHPFELDGKKLLAVFNGVGLVIRNLSDGSTVTNLRWKTSYDINAITPIVDGSKVFIASGYSKGGILVDIKDGEPKEVWKQKKVRSDFSTPVLWKGFLYGMDDKSLACADFATGDVKWTEEGFGKGALILAAGKLIVQTQQTGELVLVDANPEQYKEIARTKVFDGESCVMPVLANGLLYAKSNLGKIVCLDVRGK
jgi:outer membrane protein assembly factor BamB